MTISDSTQSTPHPPTQPLFLSPDEILACDDIDKHGIDMASLESLEKLGFLATYLATRFIDFTQHYPTITPAGLVLNADILLPFGVRSADAPKLITTHQRFMAFSEEDRVAMGKLKIDMEGELGARVSLSDTMDKFESSNE